MKAHFERLKRECIKLLSLLVLLFSSCTATKFLKEGESFYAGAEIDFKTEERIGGKKSVRKELETLITPKPNGTILGSRPGVWFYFIAGTPKKKKGLKSFIKNKMGQPPVLLKDATPDRTAKTLASQLNNEGYFKSVVKPEVKTKRKKSTVIYTVNLNPPYHLQNIHYSPGSDSTYAGVLKTLYEKSILKPKQRYQLVRMQAEQQRIEEEVENFGFYYFDDRYLIFQADSTVGDKQVDLDLQLEPGIPERAGRIFKMKDISIFPNYTLTGDTTFIPGDTTYVNDYAYVDDAHHFRPEIIADVVNLKKGEIYSRDAHDLTLSHLMGLGTFKFVNIKFKEANADSALLNADIFLTPLKKNSIRMEVQAVSKSNNFVGPGFLLTFTNRNFLRGAELFQVKLNTAYEVQISKQSTAGALNSFEVGLETSLTIPRFISPISIDYSSRKYLPKTQIKTGFNVQNRIGYFRLNSFNLGFGYNWRETASKTHELFVADINYVKTDKTSQEFKDKLEENPVLKSSFENQFIVGTKYSFTLNTQLTEDAADKYQPKRIRTHNFYFNANVNVAGNLLNALVGATSKSESGSVRKLFGAPYSQFVRGDVDLRYYLQFDKHSKLASRIILGSGYAYGNASTLPYIKQFSIGGSNSIRAFPARSIGPGTFSMNRDSQIFIDQRGDIKLEGSVEYRFDIFKFIKGATFVDGGNIWLWKEDAPKDSEFTKEFTKDFLKQLAVGTGAGLRFDFSFFVLRFDVAFPLRKPAEKWVTDQIDFGSSEWRKDNLVYNIAIGYPF